MFIFKKSKCLIQYSGYFKIDEIRSILFFGDYWGHFAFELIKFTNKLEEITSYLVKFTNSKAKVCH